MTKPTVGAAVETWFLKTWLYDVVLSCVIGIVIGTVFRYLLLAAEKADLIDKNSFLAFAVSLAFLLTGFVATIKSDDLLACFLCGNAFTWDDKFRKAVRDEHFQEVIETLLNLTFFVILGGVLPWNEWYGIGYGKLFGLAILVLLLKRLPLVMLLQPVTPVLKTKRDAFFAGWFGPIGVGAIFFAL